MADEVIVKLKEAQLSVLAGTSLADSDYVRIVTSAGNSRKTTLESLMEFFSDSDPKAMLLTENIPNTVQTYTYTGDDITGILHKRNGTTIRTDVYTFTDTTVTEVRTLNTGQSLTIVTNLDTLETTVTKN